jgi:DNA-binding transcriptional LysR family regulator
MLKVTAPVDLGNACLVGMASSFSKRFPNVELEFSFSDRFVDLVSEGVSEGIDVAIRAGHLKNSGLIAKKLGTSYWVPYASPSYLKNIKAPSHPKELVNHRCLQFTPFGDAAWELRKGSSIVRVAPRKKIGANDMNFTKALCLKGEGIALLPTFSCHIEVKSGKLVRLLPEWVARIDPLHVVYPEQKFIAAKTRVFIDAIVDEFKSILKEETK